MSIYKKIYIAVSLLYLAATLYNAEFGMVLLKPLLLPVLMLMVYKSQNVSNVKLLLSAQFFSFVGDTVLLFAGKGEMYFILGLVAFLIAQVCFSLLFIKDIKYVNVFKTIPFLLLAIILVALLKNNLGSLLIPVIAYACVITAMGSTASLRSVQRESYVLVLSGAVFFVLSDSLLAINKFYNPLPQAGFLIMATYITAQYLIAEGVLKNKIIQA